MGREGGSTRRGFLARGAGVGLGAALGTGSALPAGAAARAPAPASDSVPFYGAHQAGIATPSQEHLQFGAFDVTSRSVDDLRSLLRTWSAAAAEIAEGRPVGPRQTGSRPPVDTGESAGLSASRVTVTFGLGPGLFQPRRFGLARLRPAPLVKLPRFSTDHLQGDISGGDLAVQVCADDPQVAFHALHDLIRLARPVAAARWVLAGFGATGNSSGRPTPRNLLGFKDGTANVLSGQHGALNQFVWARSPQSPAWMDGGSYMVVRRIQLKLGHWDASSLNEQQATIGRNKLSGAPLGEHHERDPINLAAQHDGSLVIPWNAHIRLASSEYNGGERLLRRGFSYVDGVDPSSGLPAAGLLFICFQRDPRSQFIPIQRGLAQHDALNEFTRHIGSAIFACPPGTRPGGFVGEKLFA
jgi:deferrochelatase/peroxidase EfeB